MAKIYYSTLMLNNSSGTVTMAIILVRLNASVDGGGLAPIDPNIRVAWMPGVRGSFWECTSDLQVVLFKATSNQVKALTI